MTAAIKITANGETRSIAAWARVTGINPSTIALRIREGMDPAEAVTKPAATKAERAESIRQARLRVVCVPVPPRPSQPSTRLPMFEPGPGEIRDCRRESNCLHEFVRAHGDEEAAHCPSDCSFFEAVPHHARLAMAQRQRDDFKYWSDE